STSRPWAALREECPQSSRPAAGGQRLAAAGPAIPFAGSAVEAQRRRSPLPSGVPTRYDCGGPAGAAQEQPRKPQPPDQSEPVPRETIPPEIVEWARQTFDEAEFLARVREIEATGGLRLDDFIAEVEARARSK